MPPTGWLPLLILVLFFIPGFILDTVYGFSTARPKRENADAFLSYLFCTLVSASPAAIGFLVLLPGILQRGWRAWLTAYAPWLALAAFLSMFVLPLLIALGTAQLLRSDWVKGWMLRWFALRIGQPPKAWDKVLSLDTSYQVLVTLTDGSRVGGGFGQNSFASAFPADEDLYLEVQFTVEPDGTMVKPIENTRGVLIKHAEVRYIELRQPASSGAAEGGTDGQQGTPDYPPTRRAADRGNEADPVPPR